MGNKMKWPPKSNVSNRFCMHQTHQVLRVTLILRHNCPFLKRMEEVKMKAIFRSLAVAALIVAGLHAADGVVSAVHGVVTKVDAGTKTILVKTEDGTAHT